MARDCCSTFTSLTKAKKLRKEKQNQLTIADRLQHVNSSLVHFTASFQVLLKESQGAEESAVILQDLYMIRHMALHLKVLFGLKSDERQEWQFKLDVLKLTADWGGGKKNKKKSGVVSL